MALRAISGTLRALPQFIAVESVFFFFLPFFVVFVFVAGVFAVATAAPLENGGTMSEPSAVADFVVSFGGSLVGLGAPLLLGALALLARSAASAGSGPDDPVFADSDDVSASGAFASCFVPPHAAVSENRTENPIADRVLVRMDPMLLTFLEKVLSQETGAANDVRNAIERARKSHLHRNLPL